MKFFNDFITNYVLMSAISAWLVAQILKGFTGIFKLKKFTVTEFLFGTGGMPSSHTAAIIATACATLVKCGVGSVEFAIAGVLSMIVVRDAMGLRRQVGEHAKTLNIIIKELSEAKNDSALTHKALGELAGHSPLQVLFGGIVGAAVAFSFVAIPAFGII